MSKIRSIRSAVKALTNQKKDELTEAQIYTSRQMRNYLRDMSKSLCGDVCRAPDIHLIAGGEDGVTACTDGNRVIINYESGLCRFFSTPENRFIAFMGLFYHEHSHILYNEFGAAERARNMLDRGAMYGEEPCPKTKEEQDALVELKAAIADPIYTPIFQKVYAELDNTVIDPHDEGKMMDEFGGLAVESITKMNEALRAGSMSLETIEGYVREGKITKLTAMYSLMLDYIYFFRILCFDEKLEKSSELMKVLYTVSPHVETARWTDDPKEKFSELNYVVLALWPFIKEELQKMQDQQNQSQGNQNSQQSQNQQGGQNGQPNSQKPQTGGTQQPQQGGQSGQNQPLQQPTQEQIEQILQQLSQGAQNAPQTQAPQGKSSKKALENAQIARSGKQQQSGQPASGSKASQEALNAAFNQVIGELAQQYSENQLETEQGAEIQHNASTRLSQTSSHKGVPVDVGRITEVSDSDIARYDEEMKEIGLYSKRLQKAMLEIMRDLQLGGLNRHKSFGRIICPKDAYRPDELMFANKKLPVELPDMAVSVLVDHSGSMGGSRIEMSCKAAMLLHDFARGIGIPVAVCGHRTRGNEVKYIVYTDFDQYSERDRYRLAQMSAGGCNRDGAAIEISADRLSNRPEKLKLLIVISDGQPNHDGYGGDAAEKDIQDIIRRYKRKGVEIIGAAIGDDREVISRIYGDGFLDITDLSTLPKTLTKLVQKRLLSQIV